MKYLEEKNQFSEDYKRAVLEQIKKKRQIMDKLVAKESKIRNVGGFVQKCTPKKKVMLD